MMRQHRAANRALADRIRWLNGLTAACTTLVGTVYLVAVKTEWGHRAGNAALAGRHNRAPELASESVSLLDTISVISLGTAGGALMAIGYVRGGWRLSLGTGGAILGANVTTQLLKRVVFDRPTYLDPGDDHAYANSLPSGHATVAMSLAVGIALVAPARYRWLGAISAGAYARAVGAATITAGWHRPSDVMAGDLVAVGWGSAAAAILLATRDRGVATKIVDLALAERRQAMANATLAGGGLLAAGAMLVFAGATIGTRWDELRSGHFDAAFFAEIGTATGTGLTAGAAFLAALAGLELAGIDDGDRPSA
jgi:membrane-associated phospholipid phosphatase